MDLQKLNTLTKYPSIPTYHSLGSGGRLTSEHVVFPDDDVILTEKVDGTNARIVLTKEHTIVGSRKEFLWAVGDLIKNPAQQIVETIAHLAEHVRAQLAIEDATTYVIFGEVFGGKTSKAGKQYGQGTGFRLFDIAKIHDAEGRMANTDVSLLASWRESDTSRWLSAPELEDLAEQLAVPLTPRLSCEGSLPTSVEGMARFLEQFAETQCVLDSTAKRRSEGLVIRTSTRSVIAKARFEDYARTLR